MGGETSPLVSEGDRATPAGHFRLIEGFFKPGIARPASLLPDPIPPVSPTRSNAAHVPSRPADCATEH